MKLFIQIEVGNMDHTNMYYCGASRYCRITEVGSELWISTHSPTSSCPFSFRCCGWLCTWGGITAYTSQLPLSSWHLMTRSPMTVYIPIPNTGHWWGCRSSTNNCSTCKTHQSFTIANNKDLKSESFNIINSQNNIFVLNRNPSSIPRKSACRSRGVLAPPFS